MAGRKSAQTTQQTVPMQGRQDGGQSSCPMNPFCSAEFAAIAGQYEQLFRRIDELKLYLKEEYTQSIDHRIATLSARIAQAESKVSETEKTVHTLLKKVVFACGGLSVLVFLINIAVTVLTRLLIR